MIVDVHTHVFPPKVISERDLYVRSDATFAELYGNPEAKLASADDLLRSMDEAGIDVSVALGFAWKDPVTCRLHNDYLLEAAERSDGRLIAFPSLPLGAAHASGAADFRLIEEEARRCAAAGARGFGELRPENLGFDPALPAEPGDAVCQGDRLAALAADLDVALLFHVSEPVGHAYSGKQGFGLGDFYDFASRHPAVRVIGAHWAGGLPFYARMPEVKALFSAGLRVDTAASSLLYDATVYAEVTRLVGPEAVLFGSDYPLLSQKRSLRRLEESGLAPEAKRLVLGDSATAFLKLR
ncbi:MAG TPA: amidohydrolase family protein [Dehalococcoidia bacterium]|nr:amidohydrolase family protein [Dehalococcoidia bacterium]